MRCARYQGGGRIEIVTEPDPSLPPGGLLVRTEACGLCSGELMDWYMDQKIPHVLGHEVAGIVLESEDVRFPVGSRVFPHHHAPCHSCEHCRAGNTVHCDQWKRTKLIPGGMADLFAVPSENLNDTILANELRAIDAALIEPLACVAKSISRSRLQQNERAVVIGLGVMGLMHAIITGADAIDFNPVRCEWAQRSGVKVVHSFEPDSFDIAFVCPGTSAAMISAINAVRPGGRILLFSPFGPGDSGYPVNQAYFKDIEVIPSYSCGPEDTATASEWLRQGRIQAEQVVSDFVTLDQLPESYLAMKSGSILKSMVLF